MNRPFELLAGLIFVAVTIFLHLKFMGLAVMGLNVGLIIAYLVWMSGDDNKHQASGKVLSIYLVAIAVQCLHFCEEYAMDFHGKFPGLLGYRWPDQLFVAFNLIWLFVFVLAAWGVLHQVRLAYLIVWFFAIVGGVGNGIVHAALSVRQGGYFPGLITAPFHLVIGVLLIKTLLNARRTTTPNLGDQYDTR